MATTAMVPLVFEGGNCFNYEVIVAKSFWDADPLTAGLAFFFGVLIGSLVGVLCAFLCLKDMTRHKEKDSTVLAEHGYVTKSKVMFVESSKVSPTSQDADVKVNIKRKKSGKRRRPGTGKADDPAVPINLMTIDSGSKDQDAEGRTRSKSKGLADALLQPNGAAMDAELSNQDLDSVTALDNDLREENINTMVQMLRVLLQQQMMKGNMNEEDFKDMMKGVQSDISSALSTANREKDEQEEEIRKKYKNNPDKMDQELDKLHGRLMTRITSLMGDATNKIRKDIGKNSKLSEDEVDALMADLNNNLAESERRLAEQRSKQALALEERLARRKQLAEMHRFQKEQQSNEIETRKEIHERSLNELVDDGKMLERQKQDLLDAYNDDQTRIYQQHQEQMQRQQLHLAEKLAASRAKKLAQLEAAQEEDREEFISRADANTNTDSVRESFHQMIARQRQEKDDLVDELDTEEADHFTDLLKKEEKELKKDLNETEERLHDSLQSRAQLSEGEAERLMTIHDAEMAEYEKSKKHEKKKRQARMQEKLEQRRQRAEEETMLAQAEQQTLVEQQANTVQKVLNSQLEMDNDAKEKILREHEQQMTKVNNQLQMSKLRQQKALEQRLNKRRAKVANLKDEQERLRREAKDTKEKDKDKLADQLEKQIKEEEKNLEDMKKSQLAEMRRAFAEETAEALREQEKQLSVLIARLEVGQARRQALIARQDKTIKELEAKMVNKVGENEEDLAGKKVDVIINQHSKEVERLEDKMSEARERQEATLQERLQAKKLKRERQVEKKLEDEAQEEWHEQKTRPTGLATSILGQMMLEQRHKMAMEQLSREMQQEMQKQREELNRELEIEMKIELEEQKKSFLAQLAAISNMSKEEVNEVVESAVNDAGGSEKQAKKLTKEMRIEIKRAKTELGTDDREPSSRMRRARTDMYDDEEPLYQSRPKSGRRPPPRGAFNDDDY